MMVKKWSYFLFSFLTILTFSQDTLTFKKTSCTIPLKQICPHLNGAYIGLDYNDRLLILDTAFKIKSYGPQVGYINLNAFQSPLQLIAVSNENTIIYLDHNLSINRSIAFDNPTFIDFVSPTSNSQIWINLNNQITLYDPFFNSKIKTIETPNNISDIKSVTYIDETLYIIESNTSYEVTQNTITKHKNNILGVVKDNNKFYTYTDQKLTTTNLFHRLPFKNSFIHVHNNHILGIDTKGSLYRSTLIDKNIKLNETK